MNLNQRARTLCQTLLADPDRWGVAIEHLAGTTLIDLGINVPGGLEAGRLLAKICLAGLGDVDLVPSHDAVWPGPAVAVHTDHPIAACMAAQYAGWQLLHGKFFAMGSGPMRAASAKEQIFQDIGHTERPEVAVGVLETRQAPPAELVCELANACRVPPEALTLLMAPTASLAGTVQVVARSVETALHKLHELKFDLRTIVSGWGLAPLPPPARNDLAAIGRTNDAILYGADVTLWVRGDDAVLQEIGPRVPSCASADHGEPFASIFERYGRDFYRIDKLLFSPARVTFINLNTGRSFCYGQILSDVIRRSFLG